MNNKRGFVQIPILIAIIISAIVFGGSGYLIVRKISQPSSPQLTLESSFGVLKTSTIQPNTTTKKQTVTSKVAENKNYNYIESEIGLYNGLPEMFGRMAEEIKNNENISYFKERKDRLVYRLSYAKQWKPLPNYGDGAVLNKIYSLYIQEFEKDIRDIDDVFNVIESNIALMNRYRIMYEGKLSQLLADSKKFVTKEEFVKFTESEDVKKFADRKYEGLENVNAAMSKYVNSVSKKEDEYEETRMAIITLLSASIEKMSTSINYNQPANTQLISDSELRQIRDDALRTLKSTTCTFAPGPSGGFAYSTVTCN